jgi:hypothetical protein
MLRPVRELVCEFAAAEKRLGNFDWQCRAGLWEPN